MDYRPLGRTGINVSALSLGTMTFGRQNTEAESHAQLDLALDSGVTFWDAAEMYPVPAQAETYGRTETIIGSWLKRRGRRGEIVLGTKILGRSDGFAYARGGETRLDARNIEAALEASLRRLQTDFVDLYQLHWPDRKLPLFGSLDYVHAQDDAAVPIEETLGVLDRLAAQGKIRAIGLSNETPWGTMRFIARAEAKDHARVASVQNSYSLLNRVFEIGLAEIALREECGLLAYSPLAMGSLTGKYLDGARPPGSRLALFPDYQRYIGERGQKATRAYVDLARDAGLDPAQMALAFCLTRPFLTSAILGATSLAQLGHDLKAGELRLSDEVLAGIEAIHRADPNPCP